MDDSNNGKPEKQRFWEKSGLMLPHLLDIQNQISQIKLAFRLSVY